jgi:hypothetical protein
VTTGPAAVLVRLMGSVTGQHAAGLYACSTRLQLSLKASSAGPLLLPCLYSTMCPCAENNATERSTRACAASGSRFYIAVECPAPIPWQLLTARSVNPSKENSPFPRPPRNTLTRVVGCIEGAAVAPELLCTLMC